MNIGYISYVAITLFIALLIFSKVFRGFVLRGVSGILTLFLASLCGLGIKLNVLGIVLSVLLGIPGTISYFALSYII